MAAETHPSSSSSYDNYDYDYDVFLSYRGEDTRRTFTDHLYDAMVRAGIRTFRDNEELNHGEEIGPRLLTAIEQSRISIPIFSKDYASSKWCLQELTKIMECKKKLGQIVWPIFYKVEPTHVRNQTGCFKEAFLKHEKEQTGCFFFFLAITGCFKNVFLKHKREQGEEKVMTWRKSLKEAGDLKGWDSEDPEYRYETNLINSVVERAMSELIQITTLQVAKHPIGIDSHVEKVMRMLDVESKGVQFVGIHGMGGIGKTTTAMAVFNKISNQFESWSFLADVRERSQREGLVSLQNKLVYDISKGRNLGIDIVARGIDVIKKTCSNKKVLIILDDVDQDDQLDALAGGRDWFHLGSRIIITTRDEHILNVDQVDKSKIYKPDVLDHNLSLQLFSKHAFGRDQPPQDFRELSNEVVSIAGGLPLSLEVLGSFLRDKKRDTEWNSSLKMLKKFPDDKVQKKLQISYDGLNQFYKDIFLDIACFFIGVDEESVILALEDIVDCPRVGIKVLVHKSLVKIDSDNKLRMHDQLRDMGREIVRQENPKKPGERSRLWSHKEALDVLKKHTGTRNVEGLFLDFGYEVKNYSIDFDYKAFEVMSGLRLLQVDHAYHDGNNFGHLHRGLKWLSLKGIPSKCVPTISHLEKLAVLNLFGSDITDDWNGWQQIQLIGTLKVLDLSNCRLLESTPHFSCDTSLERLILDNCINLVAFHEPIGYLKKLVFLSLNRCIKLTELPDSICKLGSIRSVILSDCYKIEKLPKELGNMESLTELIIDRTRIEEIPDSIGLLEKLETLSARGCWRLKKLPNLSNLKSLQALCLSDCKKLFEIQGISGLSLLQQLDLEGCEKLKLLPELPPGLIKLNIGGCTSMERLPNLSSLKNLKELGLDNCYKLAKIEGIDGLTLLQELDLTSCKGLQSLPELPSSLIKLNATSCSSIKRLPNMSNLKNLQALLLCGCLNLFKIQGINGLSLLQQLDLKLCITLQSLPELPPSLIRLDVSSCISMKRLPNLSTMKHLKEFSLVDYYKLAEIGDIDDLSLHKVLDSIDCMKLQSLPELPSSLIKLDATYCGSIETLPNLSNLKSLQVLHLCCSNLSEIQDISGLSLLQELDLNDCKMLQYLPGLPSSLIKLEIEDCISMKRLPNLSSLRSLQVLCLSNCMNLANIRGLNDLTLLQELYLEHCSKLQSLSELHSSLTRIHVYDCENLFEIQGINGLTLLQELDLKHCSKLQSLSELPSSLTRIHVYVCENLFEIQGINGLTLLQKLDLGFCSNLQSLSELPSSLTRIHVYGYENLFEIQGINGLTLLRELDLERCSKLQSLSELPSSLTRIHVYGCENLFEIQGFSDLSLLQKLHLYSCRQLHSLDLSNLRILESLRLEDCDNLAEIRGLESLESLIELQVRRCYTYVKTLPKSVAEGMLPTPAFNEGNESKSYLIPDDDNIKGTIFYFVYYPKPRWSILDFSILAQIRRNGCNRTIRCSHDLRIERMDVNTDKDLLFYSCYFQGLTWFGFPLKKRDIIDVRWFYPNVTAVEVKMYDLVMEYEAMEDRQQLEKRVVRLITPTTKKRPPEYDDADPSNWKLCLQLEK